VAGLDRANRASRTADLPLARSAEIADVIRTELHQSGLG
jgi:hypothetical protein